MKLNYIEFVLENCDCVKIEGKYIGDILVDDIKTSIKRIASNSIDQIDVANTFAIEIHKDANKERFQFEQKHIKDFKQMTFDRLITYHDITSIQFELEEYCHDEGEELPCKKYYEYYVDWTGESDYTNEAQKTYLSSGGNLYIVIADKKNIEDFFDLEKIEDKDYMDVHFDMCSIGDKYSDQNKYNSEEDGGSEEE